MKKIISCVLAILLITVLFASCASSSGTMTADSKYSSSVGAAKPAVGAEAGVPAGGSAQSVKTDQAAVPSGSTITSGGINPTLNGDKIIYNLSAQIETTKFDETLKNLQMLLSRFGAFLETSYVSGNSYGNTTYRYADFTIRVPVASFAGMRDSLPQLGNVTGANTTSKNITAQFIDNQSRLSTYKTEEGRLLVMLDKATTVQDMITIESRLSDIRYKIESLTSTLQNWQNQVDFSTVTLHISEVSELSQQLPAQRSYWERMWDGVLAALSGVGDFFKDLFLVIVVALPVLVVLAVIAIVIILIIRSAKKKKRAKMQQNIERNEK